MKNTKSKWHCAICKKLSDKDRKKGLVGKYLLKSMLWFDSKKEAIEHLKRDHPKEYAEVFKHSHKTGSSDGGKK